MNNDLIRRSENEKLILEYLRINGPTSREVICERLSLANSTVSYAMKRLCQKGLITEEKGKSTSRGPKPIIVNLNTGGSIVAGAIIYPSNFFAAIFNINLVLIEATEIPLKEIPSPEGISNLLKNTLYSLLSKHQITESNLISVGVTIPGYLSTDGVVKYSTPLRWNNVPFKKILSETFNCHITISRLTASKSFVVETLSDVWKGSVILHLLVGHTVSGALIMDGKLSYGDNGLQGEIGHIVVEPNSPLCGCGNRGCLESLISGTALAQRIKNDIKNGTQTLLSTLIKNNNTAKEIISLWGHAIQQNDDYALKLREFVTEHFSRVVAIVINCFDPSIIVLDGYVTDVCANHFTKKIKERIETEVGASDIRNIKIIIAGKEEETYYLRIAARSALWEYSQKI